MQWKKQYRATVHRAKLWQYVVTSVCIWHTGRLADSSRLHKYFLQEHGLKKFLVIWQMPHDRDTLHICVSDGCLNKLHSECHLKNSIWILAPFPCFYRRDSQRLDLPLLYCNIALTSSVWRFCLCARLHKETEDETSHCDTGYKMLSFSYSWTLDLQRNILHCIKSNVLLVAARRCSEPGSKIYLVFWSAVFESSSSRIYH